MVLLYTGNTLKHQLKPNVDVSCIISHVLEAWKSSNNGQRPVISSPDSNQKNDIFPPLDYFPPCTSDELSPSEITAKLFLPNGVTVAQAEERIRLALQTYKQIRKELPISNLILSLQGLSFEHEDETESTVSDKDLYDIWNIATSMDPQLVQNYGISELSMTRLQALLTTIDENSGDSGAIPQPEIDNINASDCCALPPKLIELSKSRNIKLLAHHDPQDLLPKSEIKEHLDISGDWDWIMRLTYIVKDRQVLAGNEYLISIQDEL